MIGKIRFKLSFDLGLIILLGLVVSLTFANGIRNELVWDDKFFILNWPELKQPLKHIPEFLRGKMPIGQAVVYRPVRTILYALSYQMWGEKPLGYHLQAILAQVGVTILVYLLIKYLTKRRSIALTGALFFGLHPLSVQSVTWNTGSFVLFGDLFYFLALYLYQKQSRLASLVFAYFAFFENELTLTLPIMLFAYEVLIRQQKINHWREIIYHQRFYWLGMGLYGFARLMIMPHRWDFSPIFGSVFSLILFDLLLYFTYFRWMVWPNQPAINHRLVANITSFYREDVGQPIPLKHLVTLPTVLGGMLVMAAIWVIYRLRRKQPAAFFLAGTFVSLLPVMQWMPTQNIFFEHYTYLALFYLSGFGAWFFWGLTEKIGKTLNRRQVYMAGMVVVGLMGALLATKTREQNRLWANELSLWQEAFKATPESAKVNYNLGSAYYQTHEYGLGQVYMETAAAMRPDNTTYADGLLNLYLTQRNDDRVVALVNEKLNRGWEPQNVCENVSRLLIHYRRVDLWQKIPECLDR